LPDTVTNSCPAPPPDRSPNANAYLEAIVDRGIDAFVGNGRGLAMRLHRAGEQVVPVIVSDGHAGNASCLSPREYDVVFDRHLGLRRRVPWWLLRHIRGASTPAWAAGNGHA
jgi:hypothetical protein